MNDTDRINVQNQLSNNELLKGVNLEKDDDLLVAEKINTNFKKFMKK